MIGNKQQLLEQIQNWPNTDEVFVLKPWSEEDIIEYAKKSASPVELTKEQALQILENIDNTHDTSIGINWDVIDVHIENVLK